ncbi:YopX family protein [Bacillus safensis]|uniref:YopX family protein n=1 Tax=Bacillus safensis TaxID=561879 RepID=UPI00227F854D|nr:YopX family protein [Bacillus safensis]MCY7468123.1 YopX family protein [Bacillus safensis]
MREIKFRVWDENVQEMVYEVGLTPEGIPYSIPDYAEASDQFDYYPSCHKMQFTGLRDRNGDEIYEGDFVKIISAYNGQEIIATVRYENSLASFVFETGEDQGYSRIDASFKGIEVIGNIYQNPDLLEGTQ